MHPDLHIRITSVVHASPPVNPKSPHAPRVVLVHGTVLASDTLDIRRGAVAALFRISENETAFPRKLLDLAAGRDVHVWRPWIEIARPAVFEDDRGIFGSKGVVWCFSRFHVFEPKLRVPAPFPMPAPSPDA